MKPLSNKTLQNMYIKAKISENDAALLRKYMLCFSNLYGCIQIYELWEVFKQYKENISKEKFFNFIDITQREENDYLVINLNDAYSGETSSSTEDKLLVKKSLVKRFDFKYWYLRKLEGFKDVNHGPYIPSKEELFKFDHDRFYESDAGKKTVDFVYNLKASGFKYDSFDDSKEELLDINGKSVKGKLLKDIICYSEWEDIQIKYCKRENQKEYLMQEANISCAEKILDEIKRYVLIEDPAKYTDAFQAVMNCIGCDFGADMSEKELEEFLNIYMELSNSSNRWSMFGWCPDELMKRAPRSKGPIQLQMGPNIQKMIENGEYDLKELEKMIKDENLNIVLTKQQSNEESYEDIMQINNEYLKDFRQFLEKRNYRENMIDKHISRVEYYINSYLMWGLPKHMEEGCSDEIIGFIENRVNENVLPPSVHNIDFFITSIRLFYECMCEKKLISRDSLKEFNEIIEDCRDEMIEDYYEKNPNEIDLYDVIEAIEEANSYGQGFINIKTGEKEYIPEEESLYPGDLDELYDKIDGPNWVEVPSIDDYEIMTKFSSTLTNRKQAEKLIDILHHKKAYRNFKDAIYEMNIEDKYFDFYDSQIEELAKNWLEENRDDIDLDPEFDDLDKYDLPMYN